MNLNKRDILLIVVPTVVGAAMTILKSLFKDAGKDNRIYDNREGFYWELRRKLTNTERQAIARKRKNGEKLGDILEEMKVLK